MGIQNEGNLYSRTELETLRRENEALKTALGEAHLDIKILKKKLETDAQRQALQKSKSAPPNLG